MPDIIPVFLGYAVRNEEMLEQEILIIVRDEFGKIQTYINPLVEDGLVKLTIPEKPKSQNQKYVRSTQSKVESWLY